MLVYGNSLPGELLCIIGFINSRSQIFFSPLNLLSDQICDTIRYEIVYFESEAVSPNIISAGKIKRKGHAV